MKKIFLIVSMFFCFGSYAQTVQHRLGLSPNDGSSGYVFNDTVYTLAYTPLFYFNAYGNFVSLRDTAHSLFSVAKTPLSYNVSTGQFDFDTTKWHSYAFYQTVFGSGGGGTPAGSTNFIQYNNSGAFGADSNFQWKNSGIAITSRNISGLSVMPNLVAQENSDTLVGLKVISQFNDNSKTSVIHQSIQIGKSFIRADNVGNITWGSGNAATPSSGSSNFFGLSAGQNATNATNSNFFGLTAGQSATNAGSSNFFGTQAGTGATNASNSNFFGPNAGYGASGASGANFIGQNAGQGATSATISNFFGFYAGYNATNANYSNFFGSRAGATATNSYNSNFIGQNAGQNATNAPYSNFIGRYAGDSAINSTNSIFIGISTGAGAKLISFSPYVLTGKNNIFIGNKVTGATSSISNGLNIGNILYGFNLYSADSTLTGTPQTNGQIAVATATPTSTFTTLSLSTAYIGTTTTYTATATDHTIDCTSGTFTVTLPTAVGITGREYVITNSNSGTITIATASSQTFTNIAATPTTLTMATLGTYKVQSTGSNWVVISKL